MQQRISSERHTFRAAPQRALQSEGREALRSPKMNSPTSSLIPRHHLPQPCLHHKLSSFERAWDLDTNRTALAVRVASAVEWAGQFVLLIP